MTCNSVINGFHQGSEKLSDAYKKDFLVQAFFSTERVNKKIVSMTTKMFNPLTAKDELSLPGNLTFL